MLLQTALVLVFFAPEVIEVDFGTSASRRVRLLRHEHPAVRRRAAFLLQYAKAEDALAPLLSTLHDGSPMVRTQAAQSLAALGKESAVPFLARAVAREKRGAPLVAMVRALGRLGGPYAARTVKPLLEHPSRAVRASAADALGVLGDPALRDALRRALYLAPDDPHFEVRASALVALARLGLAREVAEGVGRLEKAGGLKHWLCRAAIVTALGTAPPESARRKIEALLRKEKDPRVWAVAVQGLARIGQTASVRALLKHDDAHVRSAALRALESVDPKDAANRARAMVTTDRNVDVRFEAALVLHRTGRAEAPVYLVDALRSKNPFIWSVALGVLERRWGRSFGRDPEAWTKWFKKKTPPKGS